MLEIYFRYNNYHFIAQIELNHVNICNRHNYQITYIDLKECLYKFVVFFNKVNQFYNFNFNLDNYLYVLHKVIVSFYAMVVESFYNFQLRRFYYSNFHSIILTVWNHVNNFNVVHMFLNMYKDFNVCLCNHAVHFIILDQLFIYNFIIHNYFSYFLIVIDNFVVMVCFYNNFH